MKHTINEITLDNGVKGLVVDVPEATVMGIEVNFRAGDFLSPDGKWEVAHVLEHMVLGANKEWERSRKFQAEFQKNGAYMNASTSAYDLNYIVECADFEWERILRLLKLSLESPKLSDEEFKSEMGNVREELVGDLNQNFRQVLIRAKEKFGMVALDDRERIKQLDNIKVGDIREYYAKTHRADNMRFVICGNVLDRLDTIVKVLGDIELEAGERVALPAETPKSYEEVFYIDKPDLQNIYFFLNTFVGESLTKREDDAIALTNIMLTATMNSRILGEARERGLAYHISSGFSKQRDLSGWWYGAELTPENAGPVFEIIVKEITRLRDGIIDDEDFVAAKQYSLGRFQRSAQTVGSVLGGYAGGYFYDGRVDDFYQYPERINAISKQDMIDVSNKLFKDNIWGLTIMGTGQEALAKELNKMISVLWD